MRALDFCPGTITYYFEMIVMSSINLKTEGFCNPIQEKPILGAFHLVQISGISGSAVNGTRFVGSSHWKIPRKSGKSKKVGPFSRLEFPNGMSCSIYVSRNLYQFQVHGRAPRRTRVYDQMEQLFTNRKFHFCSHRNFRVFSLNGKRPFIPRYLI